MGQPVVHFEVIGKDGQKLRSYYSELFGWEFGEVGPTNYAVVPRDGNTNADGMGTGGGIRTAPEGYTATSPSTSRFRTSKRRLRRRRASADADDGPGKVPEVDIEIGLFTDPEGHVIGVVMQPLRRKGPRPRGPSHYLRSSRRARRQGRALRA